MARRKKQNEEDQPKENTENPDDTFGLPEIEYEPLKREDTPKAETSEEPVADTPSENPTQSHTPMEREETPQNEYNTSSYYNNEDDDSSPWPKILGILAILLIVGGAVWYFGFYQPKIKAAKEKERQEELAREEAKKREDDLAEQRRMDAERRAADSLAALTPAAGVVDTLSERTGRYYVIVASGIDGDLIMDYAKKLAANGLSPKILMPYGTVKFHRLAIAEGDTYATTQSTADQLKSEYSGGAWVVKY